MAFEIEYFHPRVLDEIESWPVDMLADYARLIELLTEFGPSLRLPPSFACDGGWAIRVAAAWPVWNRASILLFHGG